MRSFEGFFLSRMGDVYALMLHGTTQLSWFAGDTTCDAK